ncbi:hypothetical protein OG2516_16731 [Oceanicola granulosus HTCC2516]|uniref:Uncharacterized protein n=1 Tax=Oceanicola granulosus (strain ATCC BAA-861 / DSM 15982 / KCTC 12143 / HTCC2516) TaxID=314256 RepID=Q2CCD7_OCEGH|nr:hypothetical protein [Oceanicola granulosus]EAR50381.1 hypothetical protein OG2516_16731 [Oceanicola granulosus HTCC2516]
MRRALPLLLALAAPPAAAQDFAPRVQAILTEAANECAALDAGSLEVAPEGVTRVDLDGDGKADDQVVDFEHIFCQWNMSAWHGTGGAPIHFVIDGQTSERWWGFTWDVVDFHGTRVILLSRHGSTCDDYGAAPCVQAMVAFDGDFQVVRFPMSEEEAAER